MGNLITAEDHALWSQLKQLGHSVLSDGSLQVVTSGRRVGRALRGLADEAFYASTQTCSLPVVYPQNANTHEDVAKLAPEAGNLLTAAFPFLTLEQADRILTETEGPGGGFLDDGSPFGVYSRLNLYAASGRATALSTPSKKISSLQ